MAMTACTTYRCVAVRSGEWWALETPEVDGIYSQARTVEEIEPMIRDALALWFEVPEDSFDVVIGFATADQTDPAAA